MKPVGLAVALFILFSVGCAYNAHVLGPTAPAFPVSSEKQRSGDVDLYISDDIGRLAANVTPETYVCSYKRFPILVGSGLRDSLQSVVDDAFGKVRITGENPSNLTGSAFRLLFYLDSFDATLRFSEVFSRGSIAAHSEIVLRVTLQDGRGNEIVSTAISGEGSAFETGSCGDGGIALTEAVEKSVKRLLEAFIEKVVNDNENS